MLFCLQRNPLRRCFHATSHIPACLRVLDRPEDQQRDKFLDQCLGRTERAHRRVENLITSDPNPSFD
jgi:hypothetical protein